MKNNRKEITILSLVIVFVLTILLSSSYAWFTVTAESNNTTTIKVGDLNLAFTDNNQNVELLNKTPISIDDAFEEDGYTFTLTNTGSIKSKYTVVLEDKELNDGESRLDNKYVRYILKSGNSTKIGFISDLTEGKLVEGILVKNGEVTYNLKLFLDEDTFDKDAAGKILKKEIKISVEQDNSEVNTNQILTPMVIVIPKGTNNNSLDIVKIGTEEFYNIGDGEGKESGKVKLLATRALGSENIQTDSNAIESNFSDVNYWHKNVGEDKKYFGTVEKSDTNTESYAEPYPYIYDENSYFFSYVENYVKQFSESGISDVTGRLIDVYEARALEDNHGDRKHPKIETWTGSSSSNDSVYSCSITTGYKWYVACNNYSYKMYGGTWPIGVNPLILIPSYYLK